MEGWREREREGRGGNGAAMRCQEEACVTFRKLYFSPWCVSVSVLEPLLQSLGGGMGAGAEQRSLPECPGVHTDLSARGFKGAFFCGAPGFVLAPWSRGGSTQDSSSFVRHARMEDTRIQGAHGTHFLFYCKL